MKKLILPKDYKSVLNITQTEQAIEKIKNFFQINLSTELRLRRITAPLFVKRGTGINDDLNGVEMPVSFNIKDIGGSTAEIVQSLAKWKRLALARHCVEPGYGIYTDMNAIRPEEELSNIHSLYVDQWDWEKVIRPEDRNVDYLVKTVKKIYSIFKRLEYLVYEKYPLIKPILPEEITFIQSEELLKMYPDLNPFERETEFTKKHKAVFVIGIGNKLSNGEKHDGRAPDYDDWSTETPGNYRGLNGDILLWNGLLNRVFEVSSMGIRVDKDALLHQLKIENCEDRKELYWHKKLIDGELPLTIGGGIGQSRICMFFLRKAHIGEIQSSIWSDSMIEECQKNNIFLL